MKTGETLWLWLLKMFSGLMIFVIIIIHFLVNHYFAPNGLLNHAEVVAYYQNPLVLLMEAAFLIFVVTHSLTGVRSILLDLRPAPALQRLIDITLPLLGLAAIIYGIWLLQVVSAMR
jgi:succinate dehydrogenase / fumarate reductase membrane anchor subunit